VTRAMAFPTESSVRWRRTRAASVSSVSSACWVAAGMAASAARQLSIVLPVGKPARRRRRAIVARSLPAASSASSTRSASAGSQRWARAAASTSGAWARM